jgi:arylsulfatase A-like enzyme
MIIGDDHGYPYFGFMGADYVSTPNMDKLAGRGALFTNGYAPANHCRPSLQTLLTGTLPIDYARQEQEIMEREMHKDPYIQLSDEEQKEWRENFQYHAMQYFQTLPGILAEQGYMSFQSGKWWEFHYQHGGFTHGMTEGWTAEERKDFGSWFQLFMGGKGNDLARVTHEPVYEFLSETKGTPFFLWYAPQLPHYPFDAPQKYIDMYKDKDMSESAKLYYANCTWFDDSVGELIAHLKEQGLYENTLFIYYNDNGWEQEPHQEFIHDEMRSHNGGDKGKLSMFDPYHICLGKGYQEGDCPSRPDACCRCPGYDSGLPGSSITR